MFSKSTLLNDIPWRWIAFWLLLPNLCFILMWAIGGPPMGYVMLRCAIVALVLAQLPWVWLKRLGLAAMMAGAMYYYVCGMFNVLLSQYDFLVPFVLEVRPLESPEYLLAAGVFIACLLAVLKFAPQVPRFASPISYGFAVLAIMGLLAGDIVATKSTRGSYRQAPPAGTNFTSAAELTGLARPDGSNRHLVVIVVEALGVPVGAEERALFKSAWNRSEWAQRYAVSTGKVPFYGTTTSGELRELCGRFANYVNATAFGADCLPMRYREAGYQTHAIHGFTQELFNRDQWYPTIGFDSATFRDGLTEQGVSHCVGVFAGACDREIPALIAARLKAADSPQLVYFLTLNTHLPIAADESLGTASCELGEGEWSADYPQVCRLMLMHQQLADEIGRIAMDPDLPPTDFLIAGDHLPPFFDRHDRSRFDGANVPWVMLRARGAGRDEQAVIASAPAAGAVSETRQ